MHLRIKNFRNIASLNYGIEDGKVNFLYGVSGAGKSSIVRGISEAIDEDLDVRIGITQSETTEVLIDGEAGPIGSVTVFSDEKQRVLFSSQADGGFYDVFVGNESELKRLQEEYRSALSVLRSRLGHLQQIRATVASLAAVVGKARDKGGFTKASKMGKAFVSLDAADESTREYIERRRLPEADWIQKGFAIGAYYKEGICPFCEQRLSGSPYQVELSNLSELSVSALKPLFDSPTLLESIGLQPFDVSNDEGRKEAAILVKSLPLILSEIDRITSYCDLGSDYQTVKGMEVEVLRPADELYLVAPEIKDDIDGLAASAVRIKILLGKMKAEFNKLVSSKTRELNEKLIEFGIPYRIEVESANREDKTASYRLVHKNASKGTDMRRSLSFGERNLITLLLFLQDDEHDVMLIDDPASSFDDFRRTQILKAIMGATAKTILVVSHDQAFVRRAIRYRSRGESRIGKIDILCNRRGAASVEPLEDDSFECFADFITKRIESSCSYYQRMVNVRLLCDIHLGVISDDVWGYVSAILHKKDRQEVCELLQERKATEAEVLEELKRIVGPGIECKINQMPEEIDYSTECFSEFERLIAARENMDGSESGMIERIPAKRTLAKEMLNDLVHMNDAMMVCIDPYRYPVWAPSLFELL